MDVLFCGDLFVMERIRTRSSAWIVAVVAVLCSCGPQPHEVIDLWPAIEQAGFVPHSYAVWLETGGQKKIPGNLWLPQAVVARQGLERTRLGWMPTGEVAELDFWNPCATSTELVLGITSRFPGSEPPPSPIHAFLGGHELGRYTAPPGRSQWSLDIPAQGIRSTVTSLSVQFDSAVLSAAVEDPRLTISSIAILCDSIPAAQSFSEIATLEATEKKVLLRQSGSLLMPIVLPPSAEQIHLDVRIPGEEIAALDVGLLDGEGRYSELGSITSKRSGWQRLAIPLEDHAGKDVILVLGAELLEGAPPLEVTGAEITCGQKCLQPKPDAPSATRRESLPDVFLIILDAARGDRFPGWGYSRQTIPSLSKFAEEAVSFRYAFAECPTTSCSIPALATGISFLPAGEISSGPQLSSEVTTLAEYLQNLGYRTLSVSDTPNNSSQRNFHQGFDEFHEIWARFRAADRARQTSRLATEILGVESGEQPVFLQLHYQPPHWPYSPGSEFDRFADPDYTGEVRSEKRLEVYERSDEELAEEDLEELIGLYDGNLLRADAAVGEFLRFLRQSDRWERSLIVVTSDHGEAFMEHGRLGHNSTLFDEMLHVPLMIRLPGGEISNDVDDQRLASLLDVVPTILGQLGVVPAPEVDGIDLFHTASNPDRPRTLFFRRTSQQLLAARTPLWKALFPGSRGRQRLFLLGEDPAETQNRLVDNPLMFSGLGLRLRNHVEAAAARQLGGDVVELTQEAEEALEALGYLD